MYYKTKNFKSIFSKNLFWIWPNLLKKKIFFLSRKQENFEDKVFDRIKFSPKWLNFKLFIEKTKSLKRNKKLKHDAPKSTFRDIFVNKRFNLINKNILSVITTSPYHFITLSSHYFITASLHHLITFASHHPITSSPNHFIVSSPHHHITSSLDHLCISSPHHLITSLLHHLITLSSHHLISSPHHFITFAPHHLIILLPYQLIPSSLIYTSSYAGFVRLF